MGNKQIAQLNLFDYIVGITIGSIAAEMATDIDKDPWGCALAMAVYALVAVAISAAGNKSLRARGVSRRPPDRPDAKRKAVPRRPQGGAPRPLRVSRDGAPFRVFRPFRGQRRFSSTTETSAFCRLPISGPATPGDSGIAVQPAEILYDVILDGRVMDDALQKAGKDRAWLKKQMESAGYGDEKEILLATAGAGDSSASFGRTSGSGALSTRYRGGVENAPPDLRAGRRSARPFLRF